MSRRMMLFGLGLLGLALLLALFAELANRSAEKQSTSMQLPEGSADSQFVHVIVGNTEFSIPKGLALFPSSWEGKSLDEVSFGMNLVPGSAHGGMGTDARHIELRLTIAVRPADFKSLAETYRVRRTLLDLESREDRGHGLVRYLYRDTYPDWEMFVHEEPSGEIFFFDCDKDEAVPKPLCRSFAEYSDRVYIRYEFPKAGLSQWNALRQIVPTSVKTFAVANGESPGEEAMRTLKE